MSETPIQQDQLHEIEISYTTEALVEKLHQYKIKPQHAYTKVIVDQSKLTKLKGNLAEGAFLSQLCDFVSDWQSSNDASTFTTNINQLVYLWMQAIENDESTQTVLNILKCFQIKPGVSFSRSSKFHLFLNNLMVETLQKYHLAALDYLLNFDEDLNLPNTNQLEPKLQTVLLDANHNQITALLSLHFQTESNNFLLPKEVSLELNKRLAEIIKQNVSEQAQLFFSGDSQFDIVMPEINNKTQLELARVKIAGAFEDIVFINKQSILVKPFIGCAYCEKNTLSAQEMFENARLALEHAILKQKHYVEYSGELEEYITDQIATESKVLEAFDTNNLTLAFQPIVDIKRSKCIGAEVLLRWSDKFGQNISPAITIEVLNNAGKGKLFTRWLINSTCRYAYELTEEKKLDVYLTVNLRAEDLYDMELPSLFSNALSLWKLDPKHIILEITENGILEQNENTNNVINALSDLGFKFALDDFGTGFSSLTRLRTLPIDLIKIDQSFVKNINNSEEDYKIVESIAVLATNLGKDVLAEGVENEECLSLIDKLNITKCQGYYFSKPMPYSKYIAFVESF